MLELKKRQKVVFNNRCAVVKAYAASASALDRFRQLQWPRRHRLRKPTKRASYRKATESAKKRMVNVAIHENTIPHEVLGEFGGGRVLLKPASPGTGVIAGGGVRAVIEAAGIRDVLAKSLGSSNPANVVKATLDALTTLRPKDEIFKIRGKTLRVKTPVAAEA
jgi:small subunit ribosomal protein S5